MSKILILIALSLLAGCSPPPPGQLQSAYAGQDAPVGNAPSNRVRVELLNVIHDKTAYDGRRGVYLITDTQTGREFIGVSGVGISEVGSHQSGKTQASDER